MEFTILTGMSGSGKTQAIRTFEDLGYFCVDNMPPVLIPNLADVLNGVSVKHSKVAVVADIRVGDMINELLGQVAELKKEYKARLIFLDCDDNTLVKRYKETRRTHPLNDDTGLLASIKRERTMLAKLMQGADTVIDTTNMTPSEMRDKLVHMQGDTNRERIFEVKVVSFGFKHGIPIDADMVYDARCFPNPFYVPELKNKTGNDREVQDYVMNSENPREFLDRIFDMAKFVIPIFEKEGRYSLIVAIGCTGGHHRSVTFANKLGERLSECGYRVSVNHRDIKI